MMAPEWALTNVAMTASPLEADQHIQTHELDIIHSRPMMMMMLMMMMMRMGMIRKRGRVYSEKGELSFNEQMTLAKGQ